YGGNKNIPSPIPPPWQRRYMENYCASSPMGILWAFMRASKRYTIFSGAAGMLGGILIFIPPLASRGARTATAAMTNVFILNMSYYVPVKLYSFHLLLMGVFLVLPEMRRLSQFFIFNRFTEPAPTELRFQRNWLYRSSLIVQLVLGLFFGGYALY